jgi:arylsulfatase B
MSLHPKTPTAAGTLHRRLVVISGLLLLAAALASCGTKREQGPAKPNIVLIVADDLGWNDVGYHGGPVKTPRIDRLTREGVELDRFYVAPVCSPTRAGILTGRYPIRYGLARSVITPWRRYGLDPSETTVAEALATAGYPDRAIFGKWHLGHLSRRWHPLHQGFTHFYGCYNGAIDYWTHARLGQTDWHLDYESIDEQGYATDLIADAAVRFIRDKAAGKKPFFCYVPFTAPHEPLQAPENYLSMYPQLEGDKRTLAAMITCLDDGIGRILDCIDEAGIRDNTIVWFISDNGGISAVKDNNTPLRGNKGDVLEGGIRVPACIRWPQRIQAGSKIEWPTAYIDVMPTLVRAAGVGDSGGKPLDGVDLLGTLADSTAAPSRDLYFYVGVVDPDSEQVAVIAPPWKLVVVGPNIRDGIGATNTVALYDLDTDPGERADVAGDHPDVVAKLSRRLVDFESLQPVDAVPRFFDGRRGFQPPRHWEVGDD